MRNKSQLYQRVESSTGRNGVLAKCIEELSELRDEIDACIIDISINKGIGSEQYEKIIAYSTEPGKHGFAQQYNGLSNSCIDFTWGALNHAGLHRQVKSQQDTSFEGALKPLDNKYGDLTLREIEHSLCEFQKYFKMIHKVGKPRKLFVPVS